MVQLTLTTAAKVAIDDFCTSDNSASVDISSTTLEISKLEIGNPIAHDDLINISRFLISRDARENQFCKEWRLETLLKGAKLYRPPPPPKPEPTTEYKALMKRLREDEERRQYERMVNPPPRPETFNQRFPGAQVSFNTALSIGHPDAADEADEVTYADVNRQVALIINVLVSIIACSVAIWIAARRWDVPLRLGLSMSGSGIVAVAEVAVYMGYIRRIKDAKSKEAQKVETKEVVQTWVLDAKPKEKQIDGARYRKGKHR